MLRDFLHFAETGKISAGQVTGGDFDSPFEEAVSIAICRRGYAVVPQIGVSGFKVDLGVLHPIQPGRFVLGIECDGATYHSGRSARDRDRLRQEVLEGLGWKLHRIWSTDWFRSPDRETERLVVAVEQAIANSESEIEAATPNTEPSSGEDGLDVVDDDSPIAEAEGENGPSLSGRIQSELSEPYRECNLHIARGRDLLNLDAREVADLINTVVCEEGPIHSEEVARRVREAFGLERTGRRILEIVSAALKRIANEGKVDRDGEFWTPMSVALAKPRCRRDASISLRRADRIAPREYRLAIEEVLRASVAAPKAELTIGVVRVLGFDRTGNGLDRAITDEIERMIRAGDIEDIEGRLRLT